MGILSFIILMFFFFQLFKTAVKASEEDKSANQDGHGWSEGYSLEKSLIYIFACTMSADNKVTKNELSVVKRYLLRKYGEAKAKELLLLLRDVLKSSNSVDIRPYCLKINQTYLYQERLNLLSSLFQICVADGMICDNEADLLQLYARFTRIRNIDFYQMQNYYTYGFDWKENQDNRSRYKQRQNESQNAQKPKTDKAWAYKILGLPNNASEKEIKKAYRQLAQQYHPDKQTGSSDEEIKNATEKFREINEAYEILTR